MAQCKEVQKNVVALSLQVRKLRYVRVVESRDVSCFRRCVNWHKNAINVPEKPFLSWNNFPVAWNRPQVLYRIGLFLKRKILMVPYRDLYRAHSKNHTYVAGIDSTLQFLYMFPFTEQL
jgi:hypothetical protein